MNIECGRIANPPERANLPEREMIFIIVFFVLLFVAFLSLVIYLAVIDAKDEADDINRASRR